MPILSVVTLIITAVVVVSIITGTQERKVMSFLEGKTFATDLYSATIGDRGTKELISFRNGKVAVEKWYSSTVEPYGDINCFMDCRIKASIFNDDIAIQANDGQGWSTVKMVALCDDGSVVNYIYSSSSVEWREITMEELENERAIYFCGEHSFTEWSTIIDATCTGAGEKSHTCTKCGYSETQYTAKLDHKYEDRVCTICGTEKQPEKSDIAANSWYVYEDVLYIQNCLIKSAISVSNGRAMMVTYCSVCQHCHAVEEFSRMAGPEINYPVDKIYVCDWCGKNTIVKLKIG